MFICQIWGCLEGMGSNHCYSQTRTRWRKDKTVQGLGQMEGGLFIFSTLLWESFSQQLLSTHLLSCAQTRPRALASAIPSQSNPPLTLAPSLGLPGHQGLPLLS